MRVRGKLEGTRIESKNSCTHSLRASRDAVSGKAAAMREREGREEWRERGGREGGQWKEGNMGRIDAGGWGGVREQGRRAFETKHERTRER
jgi:hypothetical protein